MSGKCPGQVLDTVEGTDRKEGIPSKSTMQVSPKSSVPKQHREVCNFQKKRGNTWKKTEIIWRKPAIWYYCFSFMFDIIVSSNLEKNRHNRNQLSQPLSPWRTSGFSGVFCFFVAFFVLSWGFCCCFCLRLSIWQLVAELSKFYIPSWFNIGNSCACI